jgi:hypothetical protein
MASTRPSGEQVPGYGERRHFVPLTSVLPDLSSRGSARLHFVVSTGVEKPDPELRKFIRSHVMLGKNKGKAQRPRKRVTKELQNDSSLSSCVSNPSAASSQDGDMVEPSASSTKPSHTVLPVTVPRKFGSQLDTIRFADAVEPVSVEVVLQCASSPSCSFLPGQTAHPI